MTKITYISENDKDYVAGLKQAQTFDAVYAHLKDWKFLAKDAWNVISRLDFDWNEFQRGRLLEAKGQFAGDEWCEKYGAILMPELLLKVTMFAHQYTVPWGLAYIRLRDAGRLIEKRTYVVMH